MTNWSQKIRKGIRSQPEFELSDTGIFNENRYFDIFIEYAKCEEKDILVKITAFNRGPEDAEIKYYSADLVQEYLVVGV